jgi:predicted GNAT family N-acyltransferase
MEVRRIRDGAELQAALDLREAVYVVEQGVSLEGDRDGLDDQALQLVAVGDDGGVIGTCRVLIEEGTARFGRLAVRPDARRQGLGAALLGEAERMAVAAGARQMVLHAQVDALGLYERAGYAPVGGRFLDEGIEHQAMEKPLV